MSNVIKDFLRKAYDLESVILAYERIRLCTNERRNKIYEKKEEVIYTKKYEYGDILPRYILIQGASGGANMQYQGDVYALGHLTSLEGNIGLQNPKFHSTAELKWGYSAPDGYPGKKYLTDYNIVDDRLLLKKTANELEAAQNSKNGTEGKKGFGSKLFSFLGNTSQSGAEPTSKAYLEEKARYERNVDERNAELEKYHRILEYCDATDAELAPMEARAREALKEHYSKNVLFPKYCNFVAVAQILEYLESGRCSRLEGADGAYNLFENELRMNIIIANLNLIQQKLDTIIQNQKMIYNELRALNSTLNSISSQMNRIEGAVNLNTMAIERFNDSVCKRLSWIS